MIAGFLLRGGQIHWLVHPPEMIIVLGTVFFGLLCTHRGCFLRFIPQALKALFVKPAPNFDFCQISDNGRKFDAEGGGMAVIMSLISIMSTLDNPEQVGRLVAAAMSGFFWPCSFLRKILFFYDLVFRRMNPDRRPGSDRHRTRSFFALLSDLGRFFSWGDLR